MFNLRVQPYLVGLGVLLCLGAMFSFYATSNDALEPGRKLFGLWDGLPFLLCSMGLFVGASIVWLGFFPRSMANYLLIVVSVAFPVAVIEGLALSGIIDVKKLLATESSHLGVTPMARMDTQVTSYQDIVSGWGMTSEPIEFHFRTDKAGYRNSQDRESADVYIVGDSIVLGPLVSNEETVSQQLESMINKRVMQVALIDKAPQEMQRKFAGLNLPLDDSVVLQFVFEGNDLLDSATKERPASEDNGAQNFTKYRSLLNRLLVLLQKITQPVAGEAALKSCDVDNQFVAFGWTQSSYLGLEDEIERITDSLDSFAEKIRGSGGSFAVVFVPAKIRVLGPLCDFPQKSLISDYAQQYGELRERMLSWSQQTGIPVIDLTKPLGEVAGMDLPWFYGDTHWNVLGHRIAAERIAEWLQSQDQVPD